KGVDGTLSLRAERFTLDKIGDILPAQVVLKPQETSVDAAADFKFAHTIVAFTGNLDVSHLNVQHEKLASEPIYDLSFATRIEGSLNPEKRRLEIALLEGRLQNLVGRVSGFVELAPGKFQYADGTEMAALPKIEIVVKVPKV